MFQVAHHGLRNTPVGLYQSQVDNLIVGIVPPGVRFFHTGVRRRKYKLGQTKQNPSDGGLCDVSAPGVGSFGYGAMRFKSSQLDWII
jgi:hypothetical protein